MIKTGWVHFKIWYEDGRVHSGCFRDDEHTPAYIENPLCAETRAKLIDRLRLGGKAVPVEAEFRIEYEPEPLPDGVVVEAKDVEVVSG